jgi:hypothetical protein
MKSGKEIAEGNYDVSKLLKTLRSEEREPEDLNGHKMMREFLFIAQKSSDLLEMLSQRLLNENNPYYLLGKEKYDIDYGNRLIRNCFIKRSPVSLDYVCVGIELPEVYDAVYKGQRVKVYPKILASIRNGYYFRDIFTSPYDGGSVIIIMLKLAETLSKES